MLQITVTENVPYPTMAVNNILFNNTFNLSCLKVCLYYVRISHLNVFLDIRIYLISSKIYNNIFFKGKPQNRCKIFYWSVPLIA